MGRVLTVFGSLRVPVLVFALPYAMLWLHADGSGGWLMVVAHAALVVFGFAGVDASMLRGGREPRLTLRRCGATGGWFDLRVVEIARGVTGLVALAAGAALLFVQWQVGAVAIVALVLMQIASDGFGERWRRTRFAWAEWYLPLSVLVGPALLVRASSASVLRQGEVRLARAVERLNDVQNGGAARREEIERLSQEAERASAAVRETDLMSQGVLWATLVGAIALGAYVLLCLRRDEMLDRGEGLVTTATRFGRASVGFDIAVMLGAVAGLAVYGLYSGWWGAWPALIAGWGALATAWMSASGRDDSAVGAWYLTHLLLVSAVTMTVV